MCLLSINACRPEAQKTYQAVKQELPCAEASFSEPLLHVAAAQQSIKLRSMVMQQTQLAKHVDSPFAS